MFLDSDYVTEEKMRFLIDNEVDMDGVDVRKQNIFESILHSCTNVRDAKTILILSKLEPEYDNVRTIIVRSSNVISKLTNAIVEAHRDNKQEVFETLIEALKLLMISPMFILESMLYLSYQDFLTRQDITISAFQRVSNVPDLLGVYISTFITLLEREEDKIGKLKMIYASYFEYCNLKLSDYSDVPDGDKEKCLLLFVKIKEYFANKENPVETWTDRFNMTLLMKLLISEDEVKDNNFEFLVSVILEKELFSESYIKTVVQNDLHIKFELSHIHGRAKSTKKQNHVIAKNQLIALKPVLRQNPGTEEYETFVGPKQMEGQEKMMTRDKIWQQNPDGSMTLKRMMLTVRKSGAENSCDTVDDHYYDDIILPDVDAEPLDAEDAVSVGQVSDDEIDSRHEDEGSNDEVSNETQNSEDHNKKI